jgi:trimethylguanosine synthase
VRRRRLFSKWEQGIQVDDEGLLSATPEALALELVQGLKGRVLDGTCGVGAMAIAAARVGCQVVACDLSAARLEMARHNAGLYGVALELVCQDVRVALQGEFDALILDPPWGGRDYDRQGMRAQDLPFPLLQVIAQAPETVRIKLPRSFVCASLPGQWSWRGAVDARGQLKFLVASR